MLVGFMVQGQKLLKVHTKPAGEDTTFLKYRFNYTNSGYLSSVLFTDSIADPSHWLLYSYFKDTLTNIYKTKPSVHYIRPYPESIRELYGSSGDFTDYYVNDDYEIIGYQDTSFYSFDYTWVDGNLEEIWRDDSLFSHFEYSTDYINPFYDMFRTFKKTCWASYNLPDYGFDLHAEYFVETYVVDSQEGYPIKVEFYDGDGGLLYTDYYVYDVINEITYPRYSEPHTVLSVNYFDIMGREISKPKKGFYIERKVTDKGVISTKHFIQ